MPKGAYRTVPLALLATLCFMLSACSRPSQAPAPPGPEAPGPRGGGGGRAEAPAAPWPPSDTDPVAEVAGAGLPIFTLGAGTEARFQIADEPGYPIFVIAMQDVNDRGRVCHQFITRPW